MTMALFFPSAPALLLLTIVGSTFAQLLIAVPNTTKPSDQIFSPSYLSKYNRGYGGTTSSSSGSGGSSGHHDPYGAKTKLDPNGGLTITIKLQPQALSMLQQQTQQQQYNSIHSQQSQQQQQWNAPYPQKQNVVYHNYHPGQHKYNRQRQQQTQQHYAYARRTPYDGGNRDDPIDLQTQQLPPLPENHDKGSASSSYDILSPIHLNNLIKEAMGKEKDEGTEDKEEETPMIVNVASTVVKNVKDIPSNIDLMFNDMGSAYRNALFYLRDKMKVSLAGLSWGRGQKQKQLSGFLDAYGV